MKLYIIGAGGHAKVIADAALSSEKWINITFVDTKKNQEDVLSNFSSRKASINFEKTELVDSSLDKEADQVIIGIGSGETRERIHSNLKENNFKLATVIHPSSVISQNAVIEEGTYIGPHAVINSNAHIKKSVIINTASIIEHDCIVNNFSQIAPNACLAGNVQVGKTSFIGGSSFINENLKIGSNIVIGSGSVVLKDILKPGLYAGHPAKFIRRDVKN